MGCSRWPGQQSSFMEPTNPTRGRPRSSKTCQRIGAWRAYPVRCVAPNNPNWLVTGSQDGQLRVWDIQNGNAVKQLTHHAPVESFALTKDASRFVTVGTNQIVRVFQGDKQSTAPRSKRKRSSRRLADCSPTPGQSCQKDCGVL